MRIVGLAAALIIVAGAAGSAVAQTALAGPLAAPDALPAPAAKPKPSKSKAHHKTKIAHADRSAPAPAAADEPASQPTKPAVRAKGDKAADPVSFGMKWSGTNDDARETRVQNYNGNATGTGGEVGLNFHF